MEFMNRILTQNSGYFDGKKEIVVFKNSDKFLHPSVGDSFSVFIF
jgi:hypothetical protein